MSFTGARMAIWACWSRNPERAWRLVTSACNRTAYRPGRAIVPVFLCPAVRGRRGVFLRNAGAFDRARGVRFSFCVTRDSCARRAGGVVFPAERGFLCPSADGRGCSFPLAGKNQRATGGSQSETAPWLPPAPSPLGLGAKPPAARGDRLPRGGGLEQLWVSRSLSAGWRAAPVGRPRCMRVAA